MITCSNSPVLGSGILNHYVGDLLRTIAISEHSHVRTEEHCRLHSGGSATLGGIGGIRIGGRYLFLLMHRFLQLLARTPALFAGVGLHEAAVHRQVFACTNPTSTPWRTICSNSSSN